MLEIQSTEIQNPEQRLEIIQEISNPPTRNIPNSSAHPRKPRKKYFGEQIQMDASDHLWIEGKKLHLHICIDDSTSTIVGGYFTPEETLVGYYQVLHQILTNYGIPYEIKTDNKTIFKYGAKEEKENPSPKKQEKDSQTQFGYACQQLGRTYHNFNSTRKMACRKMFWHFAVKTNHWT